MKTPRILHIVKWYPHSADPQNGVFVQKHIQAVGPDAAVLGFLNHSGPTVRNGRHTLYGSNTMSTVSKLRAYFAKVKAVRPDIIHFHCYAPDLAPLLWFAKRAGLKTVHSEHWSGFLPQHPHPIKGWRRVIAKWYMRECDRVLPVSQILAQGIKELEPQCIILIIPNIVDVTLPKKILKIPKTSFCVIADVDFKVKRQNKILDAFTLLSDRNCELHFYGDGPDFQSLRKDALTIQNVFAHGRKTNDDILELLHKHHVHIQYSIFETFGIATLEARKSGLWAISRRSFGSSEYADHGVKFAEHDSELLLRMREVIKLSKPGPNEFETLSSDAVGLQLKNLYYCVSNQQQS